MKRSARRRRRIRALLDKPEGTVVVLKNPRCAKPYYEISIGRLAARAEWKGS